MHETGFERFSQRGCACLLGRKISGGLYAITFCTNLPDFANYFGG